MSTYKDSYELKPMGFGLRPQMVPVHTWAEHTARSLAFQYGPDRARSIMAGTDAATNADLAAWRALGTGKRGAA